MQIPFTQYLLPHGRQRPTAIDRPDDIAQQAMALIEQGYCFECEMLRDMKTISLTVASPDNDVGDITIVLSDNGPDIGPAVDKLVAQAVQWVKENAD